MATKEEILESISKMSVMDLVDLIKEIEEKFDVSAAAVAAPVAVAAGAARTNELESFAKLLMSATILFLSSTLKAIFLLLLKT